MRSDHSTPRRVGFQAQHRTDPGVKCLVTGKRKLKGMEGSEEVGVNQDKRRRKKTDSVGVFSRSDSE